MYYGNGVQECATSTGVGITSILHHMCALQGVGIDYTNEMQPSETELGIVASAIFCYIFTNLATCMLMTAMKRNVAPPLN